MNIFTAEFSATQISKKIFKKNRKLYLGFHSPADFPIGVDAADGDVLGQDEELHVRVLHVEEALVLVRGARVRHDVERLEAELLDEAEEAVQAPHGHVHVAVEVQLEAQLLHA